MDNCNCDSEIESFPLPFPLLVVKEKWLNNIGSDETGFARQHEKRY